MNKRWWAACFLLLLLFASNITNAQVVKKSAHVEVSGFSQFDAINISQPIDVLIKFKILDNWHIYSQNPGEIGMPTQVLWQLPLGATILAEQWSVDEEFDNDGLKQRGYSGVAYYKATLSFAPETIFEQPIAAKIKWLACADECYPEQKVLEFDLPVSDREQMDTHLWQKEISEAEPWFHERESSEETVLWLMLVLAFVGGIVMNAMPCVFPVLTLKLISLTQGTQNIKKSRIDALFYALGVVICFLLIALMLWWLRKSGELIGWGFQLQSPWFVGCMAFLFIIIALMLLDCIALNIPWLNNLQSAKISTSGSFATGLLAVLIASPCTAPFMAAAVGYALAAPIDEYFQIFFALALGYAMPFVLVGSFPQLLKKVLPKPGRWMLVLKKIFAIPMFLTALWLFWVLYHQMLPSKEASVNWQNYNKQKVEVLVEQQKPVFIDFTAKWCLTCMLNKKTTLQTSEFAKLAEELKLNLFVADWTNNEKEVSEALNFYGRNSVPLYVFYDGTNFDYIILPQILSVGIIREEIQKKLRK